MLNIRIQSIILSLKTWWKLKNTPKHIQINHNAHTQINSISHQSIYKQDEISKRNEMKEIDQIGSKILHIQRDTNDP